MYKYLTIIEDYKEVMVMINSLPIATILFDTKLNIIEINYIAIKLLNITDEVELINSSVKLCLDNAHIKTIIESLKIGRIIQNEKLNIFNINNGSITTFRYNATMIYGPQKAYLFFLY